MAHTERICMFKTIFTTKKNRTHIPLVVFVAAIIICAGAMVVLANVLISNVNEQILKANIESLEELALHDERSIQNSIELRWDNMEGAERRMAVRNWNSYEELLAAMNDLLNNIPLVSRISLINSE